MIDKVVEWLLNIITNPLLIIGLLLVFIASLLKDEETVKSKVTKPAKFFKNELRPLPRWAYLTMIGPGLLIAIIGVLQVGGIISSGDQISPSTLTMVLSETSKPLDTLAPSETSKPSDTPSPTQMLETVAPSDIPQPTAVTPINTPKSFVKITNPRAGGTLSCDNPATQTFCLFHAQGTIVGIDSPSKYILYVLVFPVKPVGKGWYLQKTPAAIDSNGAWEQLPAYLGNETYPARDGDTLKIQAVLVNSDATLNGQMLIDLVATSSGEIILPNVNAIVGIVAQSDPTEIRLSRTGP